MINRRFIHVKINTLTCLIVRAPTHFLAKSCKYGDWGKSVPLNILEKNANVAILKLFLAFWLSNVACMEWVIAGLLIHFDTNGRGAQRTGIFDFINKSRKC